MPHACSGSTVRVKRKMSIVGIAPDCPSYNEFYVTAEKMTEKTKGKAPSSYVRLREGSVKRSKEKRGLSLGVRCGKLPLRRT